MKRKEITMKKRWISIAINAITISRFILAIVFYHQLFFKDNRLWWCGLSFSAIVLTDIMDGALARKYQVTSNLGAILDVLADFCFLWFGCYGLLQQNELWLGIIILITVKFSEFLITSFWLKFWLKPKRGMNKILWFEKLGKQLAIASFCIPMICVVLHDFLPIPFYNMVVMAIFYCLLLMTLIAMAFRLRYCWKVSR